MAKDILLRLLARVPGLYPLLAFATARRVVVKGWSMYPTLAPGEYVLFDRLAYRLGPPRRGDVVLAFHPARPGVRMVKRVAGAPGESVTLEGHAWTLGDDEYLLLGDAPDLSTDSRQLGAVSRDRIKARAWLVYWPPKRVRLVAHGHRAEGQA